MNSINLLSDVYLPAIEKELHSIVASGYHPDLEEYIAMLEYHLGWIGENAGAQASGKRIRPLLVLLTCAAAGGDWMDALPAGAAVELVHNFSLIHDDIQDNSPLRRGRLTVWKKWGIAQAINAGDSMFTLAFMALLRLQETTTSRVVISAMRILQQACLQLTQGQYMDMAFEQRGDLNLEMYWPMVSGKTAALLSACTELGALIARCSPKVRSSYKKFGQFLGLAFQSQDDYLGIWGDAAHTGKSIESDLVSGKKSLPVLFALSQHGLFANRWSQGSIQPAEVPGLAAQMDIEGARAFTEKTTQELTMQALTYLDDANPQGGVGELLRELSLQLLGRQK
jgi:geranylgeranyl diphosphate synthase type I